MKTFIKMTGLIAVIITISCAFPVEAKTPDHMTRTKSTHELHQKLVADGWSKQDAKDIIDSCKAITHEANADGAKRDAKLCVAMMAGAGTAESSQCTTQPRGSNNCFGLMKNGNVMKFKTKIAGMVQRAYRWTKYRYKHRTAEGMIFVSKYCTSEESSGSVGDCPNWRKTVNRVLKYLSIK